MLKQSPRKVRTWWAATLCAFAWPILVVLLLSIPLQRKSIYQGKRSRKISRTNVFWPFEGIRYSLP